MIRLPARHNKLAPYTVPLARRFTVDFDDYLEVPMSEVQAGSAALMENDRAWTVMTIFRINTINAPDDHLVFSKTTGAGSGALVLMRIDDPTGVPNLWVNNDAHHMSGAITAEVWYCWALTCDGIGAGFNQGNPAANYVSILTNCLTGEVVETVSFFESHNHTSDSSGPLRVGKQKTNDDELDGDVFTSVLLADAVLTPAEVAQFGQRPFDIVQKYAEQCVLSPVLGLSIGGNVNGSHCPNMVPSIDGLNYTNYFAGANDVVLAPFQAPDVHDVLLAEPAAAAGGTIDEESEAREFSFGKSPGVVTHGFYWELQNHLHVVRPATSVAALDGAVQTYTIVYREVPI